MQTFSATPAAFSTFSPRTRLAGACAAFSASATVLGLVVAMFNAASANPWLPDTPAAIAQSSTCDQAPSRRDRNQCMQQAAVRWQGADHQGLRLASSH